MALLHVPLVTQLIDVRTLPRSRHNPQFNADALRAALAAVDKLTPFARVSDQDITYPSDP